METEEKEGFTIVKNACGKAFGEGGQKTEIRE